MTDISEIKIAIDKASKQMYEAFSSGKLEEAFTHAKEIERLGWEAKWKISTARIHPSFNDDEPKRQLD